MRRMATLRAALAAFLLSTASIGALAQDVQQSGTVTVGQAARWVSNGVIGNAGTAADGLLTGLGITNANLSSFCISSARQSAAGRQQMCFGVQTNGASVISVQNYGTATAQSLEFVINGTTIAIPTTGGSTIPTITTPLVNGNIICASGTTGTLVGCTTGTNGQIFVGQTGAIPLWKTLSGDVSSISAAGAVTLGSVNSVVFPASPSIGTAPYVSSSNTITYGSVPVTGGGTGGATLTAHGVLLGEGTSAITSLTTATIGACLLSQGSGSDPTWASCASGTGTAGGSDTQVQFNNATNLAGSANLTWVSPALTIGVNATTTGQLKLASGTGTGSSVTIQNRSATSAYNFNLPTGAGSSGQPLISGGGSSTDMTFGTLQVTGGGTACSAASGTCLDNITNFSSTGYINRTGSGTYAFSTLIPLTGGGTNASLTASNGGIHYSTASATAILAGTATANQALLSGSSTAPAWSTATYPATTTISQLLYSSSANTIAGLATGNSGVLITSAGGVPSISSTIPSATQDNITRLGTVTSGVWNGTVVALAFGGTNANLTASTGGIHYSTASATAILAGTATASLPMLSGSTAAPTWATISYPTSASSGGIPYFSSATAIASSAALGANQIVIGGGAGTTPSTFACATATTVVHGGTPPTCSQIVAADITTNTVTNANLAQVAAVTLKGNPTSSTANATDFTMAGLTSRGAPDANNDLLLLWDSAAGTLKKVTPGAVASSATAGVSSIAGNTGAFTLANGIDNSTNQIQLTAARRTLPTIQSFLSGSGTYTRPSNVLWIEVTVVGGGGGGGGTGSAGGGTAGGTGGNSTFDVVTANGGGGGQPSSSGIPGAGGSASNGDTNLSGASGKSAATVAPKGGDGGGSGGGTGQGLNTAAAAGVANTGGGGGAGMGDGATIVNGGGGGQGGTAYKIILSPSATYSYGVGASGTAGTAGTSGNVGAVGGAGRVFVIEHYGS